MLADRRKLIASVMIGLGVLFFLNYVGALQGAFARTLLEFWPALLIGVGLDRLLKGQRPYGVPYTALALVALSVYALIGGPQQRSSYAYEPNILREPLGDTRQAEVYLDLSSAPVSLKALSTDASLIEADIRDRGKVDLEVSGDERKRVRLEKRSRQGGQRYRDSGERRWALGLSPDVALDLRVDAASGRSNLDLRALSLTGLELDLGSGASSLYLPATPERYEASLEGGSGSLSVALAEGSDLALAADLSSGATRFDLSEAAYVDLRLETRLC